MHKIHKGVVSNPSQLPKYADNGDVYYHLPTSLAYIYIEKGHGFWDMVERDDLVEYKAREDLRLTYQGITFNVAVPPGVESMILDLNNVAETELEAISMFFPNESRKIKSLARWGKLWAEGDVAAEANYEGFMARLFRRAKK